MEKTKRRICYKCNGLGWNRKKRWDFDIKEKCPYCKGGGYYEK